jgi:Cft2 family RNA processing exonuclease
MAVSGVNGINGSLHYLNADGSRILFDAGLDTQNPALNLSKIASIPQAPHAVFISHAHMDHVGALPDVIREYPSMRVYMTYPTAVLSEIMLMHSLLLRRKKALTEEDKPSYTPDELELLFYIFQSQDYKKIFDIQRSPRLPLKFSFWDAGHILGSAGILMEWKDKKIFYSGNFRLSSQMILRGADFPKEKVDLLILETTYGADKNIYDYKKESKRLSEFIENRLRFGGVVLLPVFSLGRTQELLLNIAMMRRRSKIPPAPIYITGMGTKITKIYDRLTHKYLRKYPDIKLRPLAEHLMRNKKIKGPAIVLATSGMMLPQTYSNDLAQEFIKDPKNGIAFVGYLSPESPGYAMRQKALNQDKGNFELDFGSCALDSFNFSAHADSEELLQLVRRMQPKKVILFHGEEDAHKRIKKRIEEEFQNTEVIIPQEGKLYNLSL